MSRLNVVALVSGGKDSLYSILHCLKHGHTVVALANLYPPAESQQDLDSFMYQTVGHNLIELIAKALHLPLYRRVIEGTANSTQKTYHTSSIGSNGHRDEVESMHDLLVDVKKAHPEVNAVSTGAILSDYQRTRVESVALRLGLTPLSYLWQYPFLPPYDEASLLRDMAVVGQDSRIIKVASGGLDESFLWQSVADSRTIHRLGQAAARFGLLGDGAVLGEGGEYETITIAGPQILWKHCIHVGLTDLSVQQGEAGVATSIIKKASLVDLTPDKSGSGLEDLRVPPFFDEVFRSLRHDQPTDETATATATKTSNRLNHANQTGPYGQQLYPAGLNISPYRCFHNRCAKGKDAAEQMRNIMLEIRQDGLGEYADIVHTTILLRSMEDFPSINQAYGSFFTEPNPPSRVTIACGPLLPDGADVAVTVIALDPGAKQLRETLHVQSRSYWAPANIGPYAQACASPLGPRSEDSSASASLVHVAGQIPLVPATMEMHLPALSPSQVKAEQCLLSLQHLWRIGTIMDVNLWLGAMVYIGRDATDDPKGYAQAASHAWRNIHKASDVDPDANSDDGADFDVWDAAHGFRRGADEPSSQSTYRDTIQQDFSPPVFFTEVQTLPRNAPTEWASVGIRDKGARFQVVPSPTFATHWQLSTSSFEAPVAGWIALPYYEDAERLALEMFPHSRLNTVYSTGELPQQLADRLRPQIVPAFNIWDEAGQSLFAVVSYLELGID